MKQQVSVIMRASVASFEQVTTPTCAIFENTAMPDTFYIVAQGGGRLCIRGGEEGDPVRVVHAGESVNDVALIHPSTVRKADSMHLLCVCVYLYGMRA